MRNVMFDDRRARDTNPRRRRMPIIAPKKIQSAERSDPHVRSCDDGMGSESRYVSTQEAQKTARPDPIVLHWKPYCSPSGGAAASPVGSTGVLSYGAGTVSLEMRWAATSKSLGEPTSSVR